MRSAIPIGAIKADDPSKDIHEQLSVPVVPASPNATIAPGMYWGIYEIPAQEKEPSPRPEPVYRTTLKPTEQ